MAGLMAGAPPFGSDRLVTLDHWQDPPGNRWAFQHVRELIPTARIRRGPGRARELPRADQDVLSLPVVIGGIGSTVGRILEETHTDGFLVLHRGRIIAEHYYNGLEPDTPHLLMSVSKSVTAAGLASILAAYTSGSARVNGLDAVTGRFGRVSMPISRS